MHGDVSLGEELSVFPLHVVVVVFLVLVAQDFAGSDNLAQLLTTYTSQLDRFWVTFGLHLHHA